MSVTSRDTRGAFPLLIGCQPVFGPWSRPVWVALVTLVALSGLSQASTVATEVRVANAEPVIEDHEASLSGPHDGSLIVWVWVSDANGVEDVASVEAIGNEDLLKVEAHEPVPSSETVARFELTFPNGILASPVTLTVVDAAGSEDSVDLDSLPAASEMSAHGMEKTVPFATAHLLVALSTASILIRRSSP